MLVLKKHKHQSSFSKNAEVFIYYIILDNSIIQKDMTCILFT